MKILYYSIPPFADADFALIKALRSAGHEVYYLVRLAPYMQHTTMFDIDKMVEKNAVIPASEYKEFSEWNDYIDIDKSFVSNDTVGKTGIKSFKLFLEEQKLIGEINPDVIHYVGMPFVFHLFMLWRNKRRSYSIIHDPFPHSGEASFRDFLKRTVLFAIQPRIVLLSDCLKNRFCRTYKFPDEKVSVASLGPYYQYRKYRSERTFEGRFVLFFGRLSPYKGIDFAIEAFQKIQGRYPDMRLIIAGAGPICFNKDAIAQSGRIELINRYLTVVEIADYVSCSQFVVCPYTDATQSGVILTSLGLGTPVVASDVGDFDKVIENGRTGLIVPPNDSDALAEAFDSLLSDSGRLEMMRRNLQSVVEWGEKRWKAIADRYNEIYRSR